MSTRRKHRPLYPVLAAAALGALLGSACGPGPEVPLPEELQQQLTQQPADAGTQPQQPNPNDFIGGGAPYEAFEPDAGQPN